MISIQNLQKCLYLITVIADLCHFRLGFLCYLEIGPQMEPISSTEMLLSSGHLSEKMLITLS